MYERITSHTNPKVKNLIKLGKGRGKDRKENFIFEGLKEIELALAAGIEIVSVYFCPEIVDADVLETIGTQVDPRKIFSISTEIYSRIAYRDSTGGFLVLAKTQYQKLHDIKLSKNPLVLILESVEKPGNLGGILRTSDAANIDLVIICDPLTDLFNPNIIRSSLGCIFTVPTIACTTEEAQLWLKENNIKSYASDLATDHWYHELDYTGPSALIMGTEATGLSENWLNVADHRIKIPMQGKIDSLNVSTATAILVFEAMRQRKFH
ncbi:MAG: RNA methyltransferase [Bacteroidota bacterium]